MCFLWLKIPISRYPPWLLFYLFVPFTQMLLSPPQLPWFLLLKLNETPSLLFLLCFSSQNLSVEKLGKTTRPFRYDLNQISYDYTVEVTNRFKGLDLIDRVPEELWTVHDIVQQAVIKNINIVLASFVHQYESATGIHMSPASWIPSCLATHPTPLGCQRVHGSDNEKTYM